MKFSRRRRSEMRIPRLPLVAFIDVILFLLLYFMMSSNFSTEESRLQAGLSGPGSSGQQRTASLSPQIVRLERTPSGVVYRIGDRTASNRDGLGAILRLLPKEGGLYVRVPGDVQVAAVAAAMQAGYDAGFSKVSYVPEP